MYSIKREIFCHFSGTALDWFSKVFSKHSVASFQKLLEEISAALLQERKKSTADIK